MELALSLPQNRVTGLLRATRPSAADHGADISSWRMMGSASPVWFTVFLDGSVAASANGPGGAGAPEVWLLRRDRGGGVGWSLLGYLHGNQVVPIAGANQGWAESLQFVGTGDRLAIVAVPTAGVLTAEAEPVETHGGF